MANGPAALIVSPSVIALSKDDYQSFIGWLQKPVVATVMPILLSAFFHHMALGLQIVIEDYVIGRD